MVFPHNEAVANATHKKRKRTSSTKAGVTKRKGTATSTSTSTADTRSTRCCLKLFSVSLLYHVQSPHQYIFFSLFTQNLELDPMTLFFSKFCNPSLFFKTPGALKPQNIQGRHQGRSVPSRKNLHQRGLLQLWQPAHPAPLQKPEAKSNSNLKKVRFLSVILAAVFLA